MNGATRSLYRRSFCLDCSPFNGHNTSKAPGPGAADSSAVRRARRTRSQLRYQRKRRLERKNAVIAARDGRCEDCGYSICMAALEFHHRDPTTKQFGLAAFNGSTARFLAEAEKCDLVCASCHRIRHAAAELASKSHPVVVHRRQRKLRAIAYMGSTCYSCHRDGPPALFEFHHWDAAEKDFGLSESGIPRRWEKTLAELAKCVMLCANCHREVHAGVRELDEGLLGLAEPAAAYSLARSSHTVSARIPTTDTAMLTHHGQIARSTNSSTYVRYAA